MEPNATRLADLYARLAAVKEARSAALLGTSVSMGGATLARQSLADLASEEIRIRREIADLERIEAGGTVTQSATVRFPAPGAESHTD